MWQNLAQENFEAASELRTTQRWRSCGSRAYYAAYSQITAALLRKGLTPRLQYGTWGHDDLPKMAATHLLNGSAAAVNLASALSRLYRLRLFADYRPESLFGRKEAFRAVGLMYQVFQQTKPEFDL